MRNKLEKIPNFFIVGAPKCGTTALSEYLSSHPNVFITSPKEPHFFAEEFRFPTMTTWEQYLGLFENVQPKHKIIGEASVHYLCSVSALNKIYQFNSDAKIIAMVRNPVDLVYSYHSQLLYNVGDEDETDFEKAWSLQYSRKQGQNIPPLSRNPATLQYKNIGSLGTQIEKLLSIFPAKQIKVIIFDDFKASTKSIYEEVLDFLEISNNNRTDFPQINKNKEHRFSLLSQLTQKPPESSIEIANKFKQILGIKSFGIVNIIRILNTKTLQRPPLEKKFESYLINEFRDEILKLSSILNRDFNHWLN